MVLEASSSRALAMSEHIDALLAYLLPYQWYIFDVAIVCTAIWTFLRWYRTSHQRIYTTQLQGPPRDSFLYGVGKRILDAQDPGAIYEAWAKEYGPVYAVPSTLGMQRIVLCDAKAIAHFHASEVCTYIKTPLTQQALADFPGKGLIWAQGESHRRQRKALTPAFGIAAIRRLTSVIYDSAYKAKDAWDALIESSGGDCALIDVQNWMNHISLDTIGLAGFSHDFGSLEGKQTAVAEVFDTLNTSSRAMTHIKGLILLAQKFPFLISLPTSRMRLVQKLNIAMEEISSTLLARTQKELETGVVGGKEERSIIGLLVKGAQDNSEFHLTKEEVIAQMKTILLAGNETTSTSLTWALLELSWNPEVQTKLRDELLEHDADPTYDQLANGFPYLDAVVHETLRLHPLLGEVNRMAMEADVIPLSEPIFTKSGTLVDHLTIAKGTRISVSIAAMNRSTTFWGEDAKVFRPSRWLVDADGQDGIPAKAKEIHGHRHLLTFVDGPRRCLGKNLALAELKVVLMVLVKHFTFELRDGVDSKVEIGMGMVPRPKIVGEVGFELPMRVRPYVA